MERLIRENSLMILFGLEEDNYFYTDEDFEYGCFPWHMNQNYYIRIAEKIYKSVQGGYVCLKYQL